MTAATPERTPGRHPAGEFDVVVVGSGAAGMTAALTAARQGLTTVVLEKAPHFGGSSARSGGGLWIPNNDVLARSRVEDTPEQARTYLNHIVGSTASRERQQAFLDNGPAMLASVLPQTPLRMRWVPDYSDYYPEAPGGRPRGRSIEPAPLDGRILGEHLSELEPDYVRSPPNFVITQADFRWLNLLARHPRGPVRALRVGLRWLWAHLRGKRLLARGQALAAGLRVGLRDAGIPLWLDTPLLDLVHDDDGRITGVEVDDSGRRNVVHARHGVILAAGGFEHNEPMRKQYQREPIGSQWTVGARANTGDAILAARNRGAAVDLMDDAWWGPSIPLTGGPWFCLSERSLPGCIMVNGRGERFVNESAPYIDAVHAMYGEGDGPARNMPTWLIADQRYRNRYVFAGLAPRQPFPGRWYKAGAVHRADTLESLADRIEVPAEKLRVTVQRFNGFAADGEDADFHRGRSAYDHYYGDPRNRPNPGLAALETAPFYAVRIVPGDLGTKGGLCTDVHGRVLRDDGSTIPGLYAAGNAGAAVMGRTYAGPGATLGPAMTFGYLAALHIASAAGKRPQRPRPAQEESR
ncbi:3-oxosteroid 1-dehydrogenase [Halopolyspora algeriensis]|uniref:3-oxosteroid 1-dehydrogenase n=1 Tax=Halopolyspora algeriensis TaxID=1500506 RepID=A0A368VRK1_9ACTN|nr:3-oxosteroid 1-dehydrogenase [Halopolyspora algeriensis]RCW44562.1 3-oxosteroid 1-dehydrogenase [Halopolyspora algeriensis]TQM55922.1 3-oxosteroid 1-dehydrogenase [Halopolyspora algeriensis]